MNVGDLVRMHSCVIQVEFPEGSGSFTYRAPKGQRFVFLVMGVEPKDGSAPLDGIASLGELGWVVAPDFEPPQASGEGE